VYPCIVCVRVCVCLCVAVAVAVEVYSLKVGDGVGVDAACHQQHEAHDLRNARDAAATPMQR
jgi:hypothetical protein